MIYLCKRVRHSSLPFNIVALAELFTKWNLLLRSQISNLTAVFGLPERIKEPCMPSFRRLFHVLSIFLFLFAFFSCSEEGGGTTGGGGTPGATVTETFTGYGTSSSSYLSGTWTGQVVWTYSKARADQTLNGDAVCLRNESGSILSATLPNGVATLSFNMLQVFTGSGGAVHVFANGNEVTGSPFAYSDAGTSSTGDITINLTGAVQLVLSNNGAARPVIDDVTWVEYGSGGTTETDPPVVVISTPSSGAALSNSSVTVSGTASDPGTDATGVKEVWVQLDSETAVQAAGTTSWSNTFLSVSEGSHTITVYAKDNAGNSSSSVSVSFTLTLPPDTTAPTLSILNPTNGASILASSVVINGTASDPGTDASGVGEVWFKLDNTSWQVASGTTSWSYTITGVSNGSRTLSVYVMDNKSNCSATNTVSFTYTYTNTVYSYISGGVFQPQVTDPYYSYYVAAAGKSGDSLRSALQAIITSNHSVVSYTGLWTAYGSSDLIPSGSNAGKVWDMYSDHGDGTGSSYYYTYSSDQCGSYSGEGSCYNREHSWPKSWFDEASPMYSDLVHVVPTDGYVNGRRSNYAFGIVGTATWTSENGSKLGSPSSQMTSWGCSESTVFEPIDVFKGDFARIYFYMATRYWGTTESGPMTSTNFSLLSWAQTMLVQWNDNDEVSSKETNRNNAIQTVQGNRNPFVDYPGLVTIIDFTQ